MRWRHRLIGNGHEVWYYDVVAGSFAHIRSLDHGKHWDVGRGYLDGTSPFIQKSGPFTDLAAAKVALLVMLATL